MRVAFDVDLRAIHGFSERTGRVCYKAPEWPWEVLAEHDTILVEVASALTTSRGATRKAKKAQDHNRKRWAISNAIQVGRLMLHAQMHGLMDRIYVAPSEDWTLGHTEAIREVAAGCKGEDNHDIRACRCMLFYHATNPQKWKKLKDYYEAL